MRFGILIALLLLAACGSVENNCDGSVACQAPTPDRVTPTLGIPVATHGLAIPVLKFYGPTDDAELEGAFKAVSECLNMEAPPNGVVVEYRNGPIDCGGIGTNGCFWSGSHTLQLSDMAVIRHEYIHYFLLVTTGDSDRNHTRPEWRCQTWS